MHSPEVRRAAHPRGVAADRARDPTNDAYAIAQIAGIIHVQAMRQQHGMHYISAMLTDLYGPGDHFDPVNSDVLPGLIRRLHEAVRTGAPSATV